MFLACSQVGGSLIGAPEMALSSQAPRASFGDEMSEPLKLTRAQRRWECWIKNKHIGTYYGATMQPVLRQIQQEYIGTEVSDISIIRHQGLHPPPDC